MLHERARVIEAFAGGAWVRTESQEGCARCAAGQGCGSATLGRLLGDRLARVEVASDLPLMPDQAVEIGIDERALSLAAVVVYGVPLLTLFIGIALSTTAADALGVGTDAFGALGAILGLLIGVVGARRCARALAPRTLRPRVMRLLDAAEPCGR